MIKQNTEKICTWCNEIIINDHIEQKDAGNNNHLFHKPCFKDFIKWERNLLNGTD